jgi:DNA-binding transcriptional regulator LsrR (DeoR family)
MNPARTERTAAARGDRGAVAADRPRDRVRLDPDAPQIDNVARLIGAGAAARLIARFGGRRMYVAKHPDPDGALAQLIGLDGAARLGAVFGGERMWMPNDAGQATRMRVAQLRKSGTSISRIAGELGLSERHVYKVLAQLRGK